MSSVFVMQFNIGEFYETNLRLMFIGTCIVVIVEE